MSCKAHRIIVIPAILCPSFQSNKAIMDLSSLSLIEIRDMIMSGKISAREVFEFFKDRTEKLN